jgi:acetyl-CoA C-acetyltransferase
MLSDKGSFYTDRALIRAARFVPMGLAADLIASLDGTRREACDAYAVQSQQRAAAAQASGAFRSSLVAVADPETGVLVVEDESIRADTTPAMLARFEPIFSDYARHYREPFKRSFPELADLIHVHHKGNSPAMVDGASLVLLGSAEAGNTHGLRARARIRSMANASASEMLALTGGIEAARAALARAGLSVDDLDLVEFNEAFAAPTIRFSQEFGVDPGILNVNGGAIALGHAMGATGASLLGTLLDELERRDKALGLVAVSGAAGIGTATVIERL